jgi:nucleoside phosphorylase
MNGTTAFLHLLRASLELNRTGELKANCLFEQTHIQEAETPDQCSSALQVLLNADNGSLPIFRDDPIRVKDRIEDFIYIFGAMFAWEEYSHGERPKATKLKGKTLELLEGWDFNDIATRKYPVIPRLENLWTSGRSWTELSQSLDVVTIFGRGLGELIQPVDANRLCKHWDRLPSERYYLAAMVSDVQRMMEDVHNRLDDPRSLFDEILWHHTDRPAEFCQCSERDSKKHADVIEILKPVVSDHEAEEIYWIDAKNPGAVCFGSRGTDNPHERAAGVTTTMVHPARSVTRGQSYELECKRSPPENQIATRSGGPIPSKPTLKRQCSTPENSDAENDSVTESIGGVNSRSLPRRPDHYSQFAVAIICALAVEADAVQAVFDGTWNDYDQPEDDINAYSTGWIGRHAVVLVHLAAMGKRRAATAAAHLQRTCPGIKLGLVVGICGGIPSPQKLPEILLGDVVVSTRVIQHDFGKRHETKFIRNQAHEHDLPPPNDRIQSFQRRLQSLVVQERVSKCAISCMQELCRVEGRLAGRFVYPGLDKDKLYKRNYHHMHHDNTACAGGQCFPEGFGKADFCETASRTACADLRCDTQMLTIRTRLENAKQKAKQYGKKKVRSQAERDILKSWSIEHPTLTSSEPWIHFGGVASGDTVMKSSKDRDKVAEQENELRGFEMEAAGVWGTLPTIVVKGVCDYSDSHKNEDWHWYAAGTAAACTKALLHEWPVLQAHLEHRLYKRPRY